MSDMVSSADIDVGGHARDGSAFRTLGLVSGRPFKYKPGTAAAHIYAAADSDCWLTDP